MTESEVPYFGECFIDYEEHFKNSPDSIDTGKEVDKILMRDAIDEAFDALSDRERNVLELRFFKEMTFDAIGKVLGRGRDRASQICKRAIRKLRDPSIADVLRQFWVIYPEYDEEVKLKELSIKRKKQQQQNNRDAEVQRSILLKLSSDKKSELEAEAMEIENKADRRAYIERELQNQEFLTWWNDQMWHIRQSIDFSLPSKRFIGQCRCKDWSCEYNVKFDEVEVLCCECLTKFYIKAAK
jgi:hypothetical protein